MPSRTQPGIRSACYLGQVEASLEKKSHDDSYSAPDRPELDDSFALWRSQYPKYGALIDEGVPPLTTLRYLGLVLWGDGRLDDAASVLTKAVSLAPNEPVILGELGSLLRAGGRKTEAMHYLTASLKLDPEQTLVWLTLAGLCNEIGDKTSAEQAFRAALELDSTSAEAAAGLGLLYIEMRRFEDAARLLNAAVEHGVTAMPIYACLGQAYERAPSTYLKASFDKYAPDFDRHLVEVLDYRLPDKLHPLLFETGKTFTRILDLGCGTGLSAPHLASFGGHLTGVDISPRMLDKARERNLYDRLIEDEAIHYLAKWEEHFDLIVSLDVLVYFGDLERFFAAAAGRLVSGGVFAISFETGQDADYTLLPSGRFAHDPAYIERLYGANFNCISCVSTMVRLEANRPVSGRLVVLRRL